MNHVVVQGAGLRTTYTPAPRLTVVNEPDTQPVLIIEFPSGPIIDGKKASATRITSTGVFEYRWIVTNFVYFITNSTDHKFALIEITDSAHKEMLLRNSIWGKQPEGQRLGGVVHESELRHYRIGFDEHGHYDVLCLGMRFELVDR